MDDDNTFTATDYTDTEFTREANSRPVQLIDGLIYELSRADAAPFHIVPATGQILTLEKLDYEAKNEFDVRVKATDPLGLSGTIDLTIEVIDVDEVPVTPNLVLAGDSSSTYAEDDTGAVGTYTVTGDEGNSIAWSHSGADMGQFTAHRQRYEQNAPIQQRSRLRGTGRRRWRQHVCGHRQCRGRRRHADRGSDR